MAGIAFLGAGAMGEALMRGLISAGVYPPAEITAFDVRAPQARALAGALGVGVAEDAASAVDSAEVVLVAVKPQDVVAALRPLRQVLTTGQTLISIAPAVTTGQLQDCFLEPVPCVRVMPNTPCLVGEGATAVALGAHSGEAQKAIAHRIFGAVGLVVDVDEKQLDAVTGLSGSGPAFVYVFIEALSDAGVRVGLPRELATRLAAQTVLGSARMVLQTGQHPAALKDMVASPGGTTIAGLHALERQAFRAAVYDAVQAATERARQTSGS